MLKDTWQHYIGVRILIFLLQCVAPACLFYTTWNAYESWPEWPIRNVPQAWCAVESFFLIGSLIYREYLQRAAVHPPARTKEERNALFSRVRAEVHDPERFFNGWFRGAKLDDIGREDVREFLNWVFWDGRGDLNSGSADEEELNEYLEKIEKMMQSPFKPGRGTARSLRLTLDPIEIECRSLLYYSFIMLVDTITHVAMRRYTFQYFKTTATSLPVCPLRPATMLERQQSPARNISYWVRPHTSKTRLPILFLHGIGLGLLHSLLFLRDLKEALHTDEDDDGEVGILAIEILQVSSRLTSPLLGREEFIRQLTQVLDFNGYSRFVLASHSYGSVLSTHILTDERLAARVSATLSIDPVTFLLYMPEVAYNFTVRKPRRANEWLLWYFASKDPGVAHTLGRHFFWTENVLWRDHVLHLVQKHGIKVTASLASQDLIVDTQAVGTYLTEREIPDMVMEEGEKREVMDLQFKEHAYSKELAYGTAHQWKHRPWVGKGVEVIWWEGLDHGGVFDRRATRARLVDVLVEYSKDR